jgi:hypothetical protein
VLRADDQQAGVDTAGGIAGQQEVQLSDTLVAAGPQRIILTGPDVQMIFRR